MSCLADMKYASNGPDIPALRQALLNADERPLNVVELGSGCGIVGIAMAQLYPSNVTLTDLPDAMDILEANIASAKTTKGSSLKALILDWFDQDPLRHLDGNPDLIALADCTYNADTIPALVHTLDVICSHHPAALIVVSLKRRHDSEAIFFESMSDTGFVLLDRLHLPQPHEGCTEKASIDGLEILTYRRILDPMP